MSRKPGSASLRLKLPAYLGTSPDSTPTMGFAAASRSSHLWGDLSSLREEKEQFDILTSSASGALASGGAHPLLLPSGGPSSESSLPPRADGLLLPEHTSSVFSDLLYEPAVCLRSTLQKSKFDLKKHLSSAPGERSNHLVEVPKHVLHVAYGEYAFAGPINRGTGPQRMTRETRRWECVFTDDEGNLLERHTMPVDDIASIVFFMQQVMCSSTWGAVVLRADGQPMSSWEHDWWHNILCGIGMASLVTSDQAFVSPSDHVSPMRVGVSSVSDYLIWAVLGSFDAPSDLLVFPEGKSGDKSLPKDLVLIEVPEYPVTPVRDTGKLHFNMVEVFPQAEIATLDTMLSTGCSFRVGIHSVYCGRSRTVHKTRECVRAFAEMVSRQLHGLYAVSNLPYHLTSRVATHAMGPSECASLLLQEDSSGAPTPPLTHLPDALSQPSCVGGPTLRVEPQQLPAVLPLHIEVLNRHRSLCATSLSTTTGSTSTLSSSSSSNSSNNTHTLTSVPLSPASGIRDPHPHLPRRTPTATAPQQPPQQQQQPSQRHHSAV